MLTHRGIVLEIILASNTVEVISFVLEIILASNTVEVISYLVAA